MENYLSGIIMGFREGLEAFLIIAIMIQYIKKLGKTSLIKSIWIGVASGIALSFLIGLILSQIESAIKNADQFAKIWESSASLVALILVTTFIVWMIKNGRDMVSHVKNTVDVNLSATGIMLVALIMVAREGAEIAIFTFAGKYSIMPILIGVIASLVLTVLIFFSLVKVNLKVIFSITLAYLILQAGFLLGYGIHEGLSALKSLGYVAKDHFIYLKAYNFQDTILDHKSGVLGLPLFVLFGWYSRPEWIQFIMQYAYTAFMFLFWWRTSKSKTISK